MWCSAGTASEMLVAKKDLQHCCIHVHWEWQETQFVVSVSSDISDISASDLAHTSHCFLEAEWPN